MATAAAIRVSVPDRCEQLVVRHGRFLSFVGALLVFATSIVKDALPRQSEDTGLSYALYTLGWGLAFTGRLFGVKELGFGAD